MRRIEREKERERVLPGEGCNLPPLFDAEATEAVAAPQGGEALVRNARRPRDELEEAEPLLVVEALHGAPEPPDHDVTVMVTWERGLGKRYLHLVI